MVNSVSKYFSNKKCANKKSALNQLLVKAIIVIPTIAQATVESTLSNIQSRIVSTILPLAAILGLVYAGLSYIAGNPNARNRLVFAILGAIIGFMAPSIVQFIQQLVH